MKIVFATNNQNKLKEVRNKLINKDWQILSLKEANVEGEIPEDFETLEENSKQKAEFIRDKGFDYVISDDTGLEVTALNGAPGVYSARYAGPEADAHKNMDKLLKEMFGMSDRSACFKTVITLCWEGETYQFLGEVKGDITLEKSGSEGFGYDPVFKPIGEERCFSEMTMEEKNKISHRARAVEKLANFLKTLS